MEAIDLSYFAGLFDGEGSVGITLYKPSTYPKHWATPAQIVVHICNKYEPVLLACQSAWGGGTVQIQSRMRNGAVNTVRDWRIYQHRAAGFLRDVRPYMRIKGPEADIALECYDYIQRVKTPGKRVVDPHRSATVIEFQRTLVAARLVRDGGDGRWARPAAKEA